MSQISTMSIDDNKFPILDVSNKSISLSISIKGPAPELSPPNPLIGDPLGRIIEESNLGISVPKKPLFAPILARFSYIAFLGI